MALSTNVLAEGKGWRVIDAICSFGPQDRPFEERHAGISVAAVVSGTFQYRTQQGAATLVPGALMLRNDGACFRCGHAHSTGDRCLAFHFTPAFFECVVADMPGAKRPGFAVPSLPPLQQLLPLFAEAEVARDEGDGAAFEELALRFASAAITLSAEKRAPVRQPSARDERRVSEVVRRIEREAEAPHPLAELAKDADLSPYHFLRSFAQVAGVTPHQYVLRTRLHRAALRLRRTRDSITEIAYGAGFNDLSTFNRRFRRLMGMSPGAYRAQGSRATAPCRSARPGSR